MRFKNTSDHIEAYIKAILDQSGIVELQRSQLADTFQVVPSQINYVIKTRFTQEHGYLVESKRGGGGYIRILKIELADEAALIDQLIELVGDKISQRNGIHMIENLIGKGLITNREGTLILSVIEKSVLHQISEQEQAARAQLLKTFLQQLKYSY